MPLVRRVELVRVVWGVILFVFMTEELSKNCGTPIPNSGKRVAKRRVAGDALDRMNKIHRMPYYSLRTIR